MKATLKKIRSIKTQTSRLINLDFFSFYIISVKSKVKITITLVAKIVCAKLSENSIQYLNKFLRGENNLKHLLTKLERIKGFFFEKRVPISIM